MPTWIVYYVVIVTVRFLVRLYHIPSYIFFFLLLLLSHYMIHNIRSHMQYTCQIECLSKWMWQSRAAPSSSHSFGTCISLLTSGKSIHWEKLKIFSRTNNKLRSDKNASKLLWSAEKNEKKRKQQVMRRTLQRIKKSTF